jgi:hypothetical protein
MTPPVYSLQGWLAVRLNTQSEFVVLALLFVVGAVILPLGAVFGAAWINRISTSDGSPGRLRAPVIRWNMYPRSVPPDGYRFRFHYIASRQYCGSI